MDELEPLGDNTPERIGFRHNILKLEDAMRDAIATGDAESAEGVCPITHTFTPVDPKFGCYVYTRKIFMPKGSIVIGKIHKHAHMNFIMQGKVSVATEFGPKFFTAPCEFVSEPGLKRAVLVEEDCIWETVHLTSYSGEENLDKIEDEIIAKDYEEISLKTGC